jgi:transposase InsO family protein
VVDLEYEPAPEEPRVCNNWYGAEPADVLQELGADFQQPAPSAASGHSIGLVAPPAFDAVALALNEATGVSVSAPIYRISALVGARQDGCARLLTVGVDTCASMSVIRRDLVPADAVIREGGQSVPLRDANGGCLIGAGVTTLTVWLGGKPHKVDFFVAEHLSIEAVLGTPFTNKAVEAILPQDRRLQLVGGTAVPFTNEGQSHVSPVYIVRTHLVPPRSEMVVKVRSGRTGLSQMRAEPRRTGTPRLANGLVDVVDNVCLVKVANFSDAPKTVQAGTLLGYASSVAAVFTTAAAEDQMPTKPAQPWDEHITLDHLPEGEQEHVTGILHRHRRLFSSADDALRPISGVEHAIKTSGGPVRAQPYRAGPQERLRQKAEIDRMLRLKVIAPSTSPWASPVVMVPKADGSTRFCVDYRRLNAITERDVYPLPRMDDALDSLGDATVFTTLDAKAGYWQVPVARDSQEKTAFTTFAGVYKFLRMPFGLVNATSTFQRSMDIILAPVKWACALLYLDDVLVYSRSMAQHRTDVDRVLGLLEAAGVTLNAKKCRFFESRVDFLGHVVHPGKLGVQARKCEAISRAAPPTSKTAIRSFLGLCGVYRRFVPNFARLAAPLTARLKDDAPAAVDVLPAEALSAFRRLQAALTAPPVLALPRPDGEFVLETDASAAQVGCCLRQKQDDDELHPIGYWSRQLSSAERNYSATEREALAIVWAVKLLRPYLEAAEFVVLTDHRACVALFQHRSPNLRIEKWRVQLAEFRFTVRYRPGSDNASADTLSRLVTEGHDESEFDDDLPTLLVDEDVAPLLAVDAEDIRPLTVEEVAAAQSQDSFCQSRRAERDTHGAQFAENDQGLLVRQLERQGLPTVEQIVIPRALVGRLLRLAHTPKLASHPGASRMFWALRRWFYWTRMSRDVYEFVAACPSCAKKRLRHQKRTTRLKLFPPSEPLQQVGIDLLGPLPRTRRGHRYLLVMTDRFSKVTRAVPLRSVLAAEVAAAFVDTWVTSYGVPLFLLSDNGRQFSAKFFQTICQRLGVHQLFTSAYSPSTNGQTERFNSTLLEAMTHYILDHQDNWDQLAGVCTLAYNTTPHSSTGYAPFELVVPAAAKGRVLLRQDDDPFPMPALSKADYRSTLLQYVDAVGQAARERLEQSQVRYKAAHDAHVRLRNQSIRVGDWVYIKTESTQVGRTPKLEFPAVGPFEVIGTESAPHTFIVRTSSGRETVSGNRVTKAPVAGDLRAPLDLWATPTGPGRGERDELTEFVVDRVISHHVDDAGQPMVRVRWHGFEADDDTWEPAAEVPRHFLARYAKRRKNFNLEEFLAGARSM